MVVLVNSKDVYADLPSASQWKEGTPNYTIILMWMNIVQISGKAMN